MPLNLPRILGSLLADVVPGGSTLSEATKEYMQRRRETARDILIEELRRGQIGAERLAVDDALIGIMFRYARAAYEGSARINLRLLAKVICGQFQSTTLIADDFLRYADVLGSLSRGEIIFLGSLYRVSVGKEGEDLFNISDGAWNIVLEDMASAGFERSNVYPVALGCLRTGFVVAQPAIGCLNFSASSMLMELGKTIDFDDALRRERASSDACGAGKGHRST